MPRIQLLDRSVYELIAAGEVIERPSSVVKELIENAIDSGADKIIVEIMRGGKSFIRVTDNGCGILSEDVPLAFKRHATSKVYSKEDLLKIGTLGFRGEALASICAVSKVELITKRSDESLGSHYKIEGGEETEFIIGGCPDGTTIIVRDLFYNLPARQKFLKKDVAEGNSVAATVQKLALSHPEISIKFLRDNRTELLTTGDGKLLSSIYLVLGKEFHDGCLPVDYRQEGIRVSGYVTRPLAARVNRIYQNFYVNNRYVKSATCTYALEEAYRDRLMTGKFPGCVLNLEIDFGTVDVNAHPAKLEIRFQDERSVYNAVYFAVKNALLREGVPESVSLSRSGADDVSFKAKGVFRSEELHGEQLILRAPTKEEEESFGPRTISYSADSQGSCPQEKSAQEIRSQDDGKEHTDPSAEGSAFMGSAFMGSAFMDSSQEALDGNASHDSPAALEGFKYIDRSSVLPVREETPSEAGQETPIRVVGEVFKTYIIAESGDDILIVDKHAAHERYLYDRLMAGHDTISMQLMAETLRLSIGYDQYEILFENKEICSRVGLGVEFLVPPFVEVYGVPSVMTLEAPLDILNMLADCLRSKRNGDGSDLFSDFFHSLACKAAIKANSESKLPELEHLVNLVVGEKLRYCPHGRPVLARLSKKEVERLFRRIQQ